MESTAILTIAHSFEPYKDTNILEPNLNKWRHLCDNEASDFLLSNKARDNTNSSAVNRLNKKIYTHYLENGLYATFKYIISFEFDFLFPRGIINNELDKAKQFALLPKGERTLIWFINHYDADKNRSIVNTNSNICTYTIERKISNSQVKVLRTKVKNLSLEQLGYYTTFEDVFALDGLGIQKKSINIKLSKIHTLYIARIYKYINYDLILEELSAIGLEISKQDLFAFFSYVIDHGKSNYLSIPYNVWGAFFGRGNTTEAKLALEKCGLLTLYKKALPGFRSALFKLDTDIKFNYVFDNVSITSIRTLEKISRIKKYKSTFFLSEKIQALRALNSFCVADIKPIAGTSKRNLTEVFLKSWTFAGLISDLESMEILINYRIDNDEARKLADTLMGFLNQANEFNYNRYHRYNTEDVFWLNPMFSAAY